MIRAVHRPHEAILGDDWYLYRGDKPVAGPFKSEAEALAWVDRHLVSRA